VEGDVIEGDAGGGVTEGGMKGGVVPSTSGAGEGETPAGAAATQAEKIIRLITNNVSLSAIRAILIDISLLT
jgi:hypothetical protein